MESIDTRARTGAMANRGHRSGAHCPLTPPLHCTQPFRSVTDGMVYRNEWPVPPTRADPEGNQRMDEALGLRVPDR